MAPAVADRPVPPLTSVDHADGTTSVVADLMGGRVSIHLRPSHPPTTEGDDDQAGRDALRVMRRIASWAERLTRFNPESELSRMNAAPTGSVPIGPTLAAVLTTAQLAGRATDGIVDPTVLPARLAAEAPDAVQQVPWSTQRSWQIEAGRRGGTIRRSPGTSFDLGGVAKGWIADRAVAGLAGYPAVLVDADGDLAIALAFGEAWRIGVADPRTPGDTLATVELCGLDPSGSQRFGLATSGTSVHRWSHDGRATHHLIDPRFGSPAVTDVIQATVLAESATAAEAAAKTIVILGSSRTEAMLAQPGVWACVVLTESGRILASPSTLRWLA